MYRTISGFPFISIHCRKLIFLFIQAFTIAMSNSKRITGKKFDIPKYFVNIFHYAYMMNKVYIRPIENVIMEHAYL